MDRPCGWDAAGWCEECNTPPRSPCASSAWRRATGQSYGQLSARGPAACELRQTDRPDEARQSDASALALLPRPAPAGSRPSSEIVSESDIAERPTGHGFG